MFMQDSNSNNRPDINVTWKPYIISRGTNTNGEDLEAYCKRRWGSSSWMNRLKQEGRKDGANFNDCKWWPNTMKAHCMIQMAQEKFGVDTSKSNAAMFQALYEEGKNISLTDVLAQIGKDDLGLPEDEVREYLENGEGVSVVEKEIKRGTRSYQISSVPFFVIGTDDPSSTPYGISGAQTPEVLLNVLKEFADE
jgi:predicted DsbA family dithiol-disulfide isomerase